MEEAGGTREEGRVGGMGEARGKREEEEVEGIGGRTDKEERLMEQLKAL